MKKVKKREDLTREMLKKDLDYNKKTGHFKWVKAKSGRMMEYHAGTITTANSLVICLNGVTFMASRLAFLYVTGSFPEGVVRHKNGNNSDNRWKNLEEIEIKDVLKSRCVGSNNSSGYTGVYHLKDSDKIRASITVEGKRVELGMFDCLKSAVKARKLAEKKYGYKACNKKLK